MPKKAGRISTSPVIRFCPRGISGKPPVLYRDGEAPLLIRASWKQSFLNAWMIEEQLPAAALAVRDIASRRPKLENRGGFLGRICRGKP